MGPVRGRLPMMTSGLATSAAVTAMSTFGPAPTSSVGGGAFGTAPALGPTLQEPGEQRELGVMGQQQEELQGPREEERRQGLAYMWQEWNSYFPICIGGAAALAIGVLMLLAFMPKGQQMTTSPQTEIIVTDFPTTQPTTTTTTTTTTMTTTTTTLPPPFPPKIACFYNLKLLSNLADYAWKGAEICDDIIVRMFIIPQNGVLDTGDDAYRALTRITDDHIYFMYLWDEIRAESEETFRDLKKGFNNTSRRYSLGWLSTANLPSVASLQAFVNVFKSITREKDSGISLGLNLNEEKIEQSKDQLLSLVGRILPKFTFLMIKLEDHDVKACQNFPYWKNEKISELRKIKWPVPAALPVSAAFFRTTENSTGGYCIQYEQASEMAQLACEVRTEENVFKTGKNITFAAENRKSLAELKAQYRGWRNKIVCVLNMETLLFYQDCITRSSADFRL